LATPTKEVDGKESEKSSTALRKDVENEVNRARLKELFI
jgi:hypothetical protein